MYSILAAANARHPVLLHERREKPDKKATSLEGSESGIDHTYSGLTVLDTYMN